MYVVVHVWNFLVMHLCGWGRSDKKESVTNLLGKSPHKKCYKSVTNLLDKSKIRLSSSFRVAGDRPAIAPPQGRGAPVPAQDQSPDVPLATTPVDDVARVRSPNPPPSMVIPRLDVLRPVHVRAEAVHQAEMPSWILDVILHILPPRPVAVAAPRHRRDGARRPLQVIARYRRRYDALGGHRLDSQYLRHLGACKYPPEGVGRAP